jgi:flagellar hook-length control protein FliK
VEKAGSMQGTGATQETSQSNQAKETQSLRMTAAARAESFDQVIDRTLRIVRVGDREATLQLTPDSLGEVKIKVVVERGVVSAELLVQQQATRELLTEQQGRLQQALLDAGADQAEVSVALGDARGDGATQRDGNHHASTSHVDADEQAMGSETGMGETGATGTSGSMGETGAGLSIRV